MLLFGCRLVVNQFYAIRTQPAEGHIHRIDVKSGRHPLGQVAGHGHIVDSRASPANEMAVSRLLGHVVT